MLFLLFPSTLFKKEGRKERRKEARQAEWKGDGEREEGERKKEKERKRGGFQFISLSFWREDESAGRAWRCIEDERPQNLLEGWSAGGGRERRVRKVSGTPSVSLGLLGG